MNRWRCTLSLLVTTSLLAGCGLFDAPDTSGEVTQVDGDGIVVQLDAEHPDLGDDVRVHLPPEAPDVRNGDHVSLWLSLGFIDESDPPQVAATRIELDG